MEKSLLKQFAEKKSKEKVQEFYEKALSILTSALEDMKADGTCLFDYEDTRIFPMGDYTNDTFIDQTGELEIVIASSNPQLITANNTFVKNMRNAKNKKEREAVSNKGTFDEFILNFGNVLAQYFDEDSVILLVNQGIKVLCIKEYGFKILVRFATYSKDDNDAILGFWDPIKKTPRNTNLFLYNEKMEEKDNATDGNYKKLVRIFKNIRKNILVNKWAGANELNKYFVELIIYNVPNSIMQDKDVEMLFKKSINYLDNCDLMSFKSFDGSRIDNFDLAKMNFAKIKDFISCAIKVAF